MLDVETTSDPVMLAQSPHFSLFHLELVIGVR